MKALTEIEVRRHEIADAANSLSYLVGVTPRRGHQPGRSSPAPPPRADHPAVIAADDGTTSADIRRQVVAARDIQRRRFGGVLFGNGDGSGAAGAVTAQAGAGASGAGVSSATTTNATMSSRQVREYCKLDAAGETILKQAMTELGLSARAHDKVLRIARTIADLEGAAAISSQHLAEAICTRGILAEAFWNRVERAA